MRERIIAEIRRLVAETGKVPGVRAFELATGIMRREWTGKVWARWGDAIKEAGFEPNILNERYESNSVLEQVARCCLDLGKWPASSDLRLYARSMPGFPSSGTIENHFPRRAALVETMRDWCARPGNEEFSSIAAMLPKPTSAPTDATENLNYGHVYLLRMGDNYKIGKSGDIEKRIKSVRVGLPEKVTEEHRIATDDPSGIEAYWHRRFADRRLNGEWFKLTKSDILAFKKRKFQ